MRTTVNKQDAESAGKSRKLFRCGVDEFNPIAPYYSMETPQSMGNNQLRTTERYFKPEPIWK